MLAYLISALKHLSLSKCFRWRPKSKVKGVRMRITLLTSAENECRYLSNCRPLVALASWFWFRKRPKLSKLMLFGKWHSQPLILIRHKQFSSFQSLSKDDSSLYYFRKSTISWCICSCRTLTDLRFDRTGFYQTTKYVVTICMWQRYWTKTS